jgi:hypothetical protein
MRDTSGWWFDCTFGLTRPVRKPDVGRIPARRIARRKALAASFVDDIPRDRGCLAAHCVVGLFHDHSLHLRDIRFVHLTCRDQRCLSGKRRQRGEERLFRPITNNVIV